MPILTEESSLVDELNRQGISVNDVDLLEDYNGRHPFARHYKHTKSRKRFAIISTLPMVTPGGELISCRWIKRDREYSADTNLYNATVDRNAVAISTSLESMSWNPVLKLDGVAQNCGKPNLLSADPINANYQDNVLEWDYGICKRRLRIIQGALLEYYVFESNPGGDIEIKENLAGRVGNLGYYSKDANGETLEGFQVIGDVKIVPASAFVSVDGEPVAYPVIVDSSTTVYSTSADGDVLETDDNYANAHDAGTGTTVNDAADTTITRNRKAASSPLYRIARAFLYFSVGLTSDDTVTAVTLSLYGEDSNEDNAGHSDMCLYEGTQGASLATSDYDAFDTTLFTAGTYSYEFPMAEDDYTDATLNASGIAYVESVKTGTAKFCLRSKGDVDDATPTGNNRQSFWTNEKGAGFYPKLVITYYTAYSISTSCNLSLSPSVSRKFDSTRVTPSALSLAATVAKSFGKHITSSCNLSLATTIDRAVTYARATSSNLSLAATISRAITYGRASSSNLSLSPSLVFTKGKNIATSCALALTTTINRAMTYGRATSSNISLATSISRAISYSRASSSNLSLAAAVAKSFGKHIATSCNLALTSTISRAMTYGRATSSNLSLSPTIDRTIAYARATSSNLSLATTVARVWGKKLATSSSLALTTTVSRTLAYGRATSPGLTLAPTITRVMAYARATSSSLSLTTTVARAVNKTVTTSSNLSLSAAITISKLGEMLYFKIITSQYRVLNIITSQHRVIKAITSQYRKIKSIISGG